MAINEQSHMIDVTVSEVYGAPGPNLFCQTVCYLNIHEATSAILFRSFRYGRWAQRLVHNFIYCSFQPT